MKTGSLRRLDRLEYFHGRLHNCAVTLTNALKILLTNMLYCIGLGLGSPEDITLRGLKAVQGCTRVYLEAYTSILVDVGFETDSETSGQQGRGIEHLVCIK